MYKINCLYVIKGSNLKSNHNGKKHKVNNGINGKHYNHNNNNKKNGKHNNHHHHHKNNKFKNNKDKKHFDENENDDENIDKILAQHPCTPRPRKLPYHETNNNDKNDKNNTKNRNKSQPKNVKTSNFKKSKLKPITTPRPESVGADPTDDEDDDDDSDEEQLPDEEDISAVDDYMLKKTEKWQETQKGPSYHAYTTEHGLNPMSDDDDEGEEEEEHDDDDDDEDEFKKDKPTSKTMNDNHDKENVIKSRKNDESSPCVRKKKNGHHHHHRSHKHVRGAEYFPADELGGKYKFIRYLGHGAYGYVAEGRNIETGKKVAIKKILRIFHNRIDAKRLLRELRILRLLRGLDSIVQLIDILPPKNFETFDQIILVFEFIDTDLSKLIQSDQYFTKLHVQYMLYQILLGLKFMHSLNIFHRDLKPANILVNEDVSLKICDFGLARCTYKNQQFSSTKKKKYNNNNDNNNYKTKPKLINNRKHNQINNKNGRLRRNHVPKRLTQHVVTRWYRAPEVILLQQKREYLGAVDMWSVGCIFGELLQMLRENLRSYQHRKPIFPGQSSIPLSPPSDPFPSMDQLTVIFGIIGTPTPEEILNIDNERAARFLLTIPKCLPSPLKNMYPGADEQALSLLRGLLQFDVEKRITVDEALSHPFIQHVRDEQNEKKFDNILNKIKSQNSLNFEFEDIKMKMDTYRSLIIEEVLRYNKHLLKSHKSSASSSFDFV